VKVFLIVSYIVIYVIAFNKLQGRFTVEQIENPKWYQDRDHPNCFVWWIAIPCMGFILSPFGIVFGQIIVDVMDLSARR